MLIQFHCHFQDCVFVTILVVPWCTQPSGVQGIIDRFWLFFYFANIFHLKNYLGLSDSAVLVFCYGVSHRCSWANSEFIFRAVAAEWVKHRTVFFPHFSVAVCLDSGKKNTFFGLDRSFHSTNHGVERITPLSLFFRRSRAMTLQKHDYSVAVMALEQH